MKKISTLFLAGLALMACTEQEKMVEITVTNPSSLARTGEVVELSIDAVKKLDGETFIITDANGKQIPHQITYDKKLIFPATVQPNGNTTYQVKAGTPEAFPVMATGKYYPERVDDVAWENDRIAFRTYGPALQATGEQAFGYDVWVKRVSEMVVDHRYKTELNPETRARIAELAKTDKEAAKALADSVSYHIDHGNGLDYYKVGPTLGAGTSALWIDNDIVYPYCYREQQILDNGPLRFTAKLVYNPLVIRDNSNVIETRIISLDAGSQMNKFTISFANLDAPETVATGIVLHEPSEEYDINAAAGYMAYAEAEEADGQTYVGAVFPSQLEDAKAVHFSPEERNQRGANGHLLAFSKYQPNSEYTYYAGAGWNKWGFNTPADWFKYVQDFAVKVKEPLQVTVK